MPRILTIIARFARVALSWSMVMRMRLSLARRLIAVFLSSLILNTNALVRALNLLVPQASAYPRWELCAEGPVIGPN